MARSREPRLPRAGIALAAALLSGAAHPPTAADLLRSAMTAPERVSYVGEVQVLKFGTERSDAEVYRIEHRAPNLTRRWYLAPQALYGDSIISRGTTTYSIDIKRERIVIARQDQLDQIVENGNFGILMANYNAVYGPDEVFDGRKCHVVLLNNKFSGETTMRVRIDVATGLVLERQEYAGNGSLIADMRIEQLRYTDSIPPAIFLLPPGLHRVNGTAHGQPSGDVRQVIASAGFTAVVPKYLPEGLHPIAADVTWIKDVPTLHVLYSDGIRTVSFFQNQRNAAVDLSRYRVTRTTVADHPAQYVEEGPTTLLAWADGNRHFALVGELSLADLEKIGASVVP